MKFSTTFASFISFVLVRLKMKFGLKGKFKNVLRGLSISLTNLRGQVFCLWSKYVIRICFGRPAPKSVHKYGLQINKGLLNYPFF